jgi:hypothetical protein
MVADVLPFVRSCTVDGPGESRSAPFWSLGGNHVLQGARYAAQMFGHVWRRGR